MCVSGMPGAQSCKCSCEVTFSQPKHSFVIMVATCALRKSYPDVLVVQTGQDWEGDNDTGPLDRPAQGRILAQRQVRARLIVQLDNITPTGPRNGKFFIPGIRGLAGRCSYMKR